MGEVGGTACGGLFCAADRKDCRIVVCAGGPFIQIEESSWVLPVVREPKRFCAGSRSDSMLVAYLFPSV